MKFGKQSDGQDNGLRSGPVYSEGFTVQLQLYLYSASCHPLWSNEEHGLPDREKHPCAHEHTHVSVRSDTHTHARV